MPSAATSHACPAAGGQHRRWRSPSPPQRHPCCLHRSQCLTVPFSPIARFAPLRSPPLPAGHLHPQPEREAGHGRGGHREVDCQPGPVRAPLPVSQVALQATGLEAPDRLGGPSLARWWACPALLHGAKQRQAGSWQRRTRLLHASQRPAMPAPTWPAMPTLRPCPGPPSPSRRRNARLNAKIDSKAGTVVMQVRAARPGCRAGPAGAGVLGSRGCDLSRPARRGAATTVGRLRAHVPPPPPQHPTQVHTHTHTTWHHTCPPTPCVLSPLASLTRPPHPTPTVAPAEPGAGRV